MLLNIILLALLFLFVNAFITDPVTTTLPSPSGLLFGHADVTALLSSQQPIFLHDKYHGEFKLLSCYSFCCLSSYCFIKTASLQTGFVRDYILLKFLIRRYLNMLDIIYGDITKVRKGIIIHQANNKGVMGAGVAKAIVDVYPQHKLDYQMSDLSLGNLVCTRVSQNVGVIAMVTQNGYGRDKSITYTDYESFKNALIKIRDMHTTHPKINYYMPFGIGCGLANGDWNIIYNMISDICPFIKLVKLK